MFKPQVLMVISCSFLVAAAILFGWTFYQAAQPSVIAVEIETIYPAIPLYPLAPIPVLNAATQSSAFDQVANSPVQVDEYLAAQISQLGLTRPILTAQGVYVLDLDTATPLYASGSTKALSPASSIKMMTALVATDIYPQDQILTIEPSDITVSNSLGLQVGEQLTVADLLQALLISSSNEAAQVLANHSPAGSADFLHRMTLKAQELHLQQTTFVSPEGFDDHDQKSSAHDLALLAQAVLQDSYLSTIVATAHTTISAATGEIHTLNNTNHFLAQPPTLVLQDGRRLVTTFTGVKTGTTPAAGEVLVSLVTVDGHRLLLVVLGSQNRYTDTTRLLTWIFDHYTWYDPSNQPPVLNK